ncbi:MAG: HD domain-containing protein [Spirochaetota bacterium]|nr:HD domain-containing protein [Spirochaetota bacterium]
MEKENELNNQDSEKVESEKSSQAGEEKGENTESNADEKKDERIELKVSHLKPGMIIKGKIYTESGQFLFEEYHVLNEEDLEQLNEKKIEKIYYIPVTDIISDNTKRESIEFMMQFVKSVKTGKTANINDAHKVVDLLINDVYSKEVGLINLIELKNYDEYTYVHSINVGILAIILAKKLGLNENDTKKIGLGAFVHDIGKINTPLELIWKIDSDDDYENTTIHEHPMFGYKILESASGVTEDILNIVVGHHENFDGSGYPGGLQDKAIHKFVKIISICNYYDYLIEKLDGKESLTPREAVLEIWDLSGKSFNPFIVKAFVNDLSYLLLNKPIYPIGSVVLLNTKEVAIIESVMRYSDIKPLVRILSGNDGKKLARPISVNLKNDPTRYIKKIMKLGEA